MLNRQGAPALLFFRLLSHSFSPRLDFKQRSAADFLLAEGENARSSSIIYTFPTAALFYNDSRACSILF
jgi:hypothetical protein